MGGETYRVDNPILNSRLWDNNNSVKFVLSKNKKINNENFKIISYDDIITINEINKTLFKNNIQSIIVEGGKKTLEFFIKNKCWDEARIIRAEKKLGSGIKSPVINSKPNDEYNVEDDIIQTYINS